MKICQADRTLLLGLFKPDDVQPSQAWLLRHLRGPKSKRVAIYYLNTPGLFEVLGPKKFCEAVQDNLGLNCSRISILRWVKLLRKLERQAKHFQIMVDLQKLSDLKLGISCEKKRAKNEQQ
jgi:hypothetical protein